MPDPSLDRRTLIRGAGVVGAGVVGAGALAACGSSSSAGSSDAGSSSDTGPATVPESEVPVGGGKILADQLVVVTQPVAGTFKAFSAICTHQGCPVTKVAGGLIDCPCHGSQFDITTGQPTQGPATKPLASRTVTVSGGNVVVS